MAVGVVGGERTGSRRRVSHHAVVDEVRVRRRLIPSAYVGSLIKFVTDAATAGVGTAIAMAWVRADNVPVPPFWMISFYTPTLIALLALRGTYRRTLDRTFLDEFVVIQTTTALAAMLLMSGMVLRGVNGHLGDTVARIWMYTAIVLPIGRFVAIRLKRSLRRHHHLVAPILIVGNGRIANQVAERLIAKPEYGMLPVGIVDAGSPWSGNDSVVPTVPIVGTPERIAEAIRRTRAEGIVVAFSQTRDEVLTSAIRSARLSGVQVWVVPRMFDLVGKRARVDHVGGLPLLVLPHTNPKGWQFATKHLIDRVGASVGLLLISPIFLTLMALVRLSSPGPIFFRQPRVGRDGQVFDCLKFRSMSAPKPSERGFELRQNAAPGGVEGIDRRTRIGKFIRATSLDELPQLLNVVKGDMSMVGPRPERPEFVELFNLNIRCYGERHRVKAGMTGWAQVHGLRGQTSIADRAEWDNYYIENWSLWLDLKIMAMTLPAVLHRAE